MESFVVLFLYLKFDVIWEAVTNLKPFLNITEEDETWSYYWIIIILKLFFLFHSLLNTVPNYFTHGLFALGNAYIACNYANLALWAAISQCLPILTPHKTLSLVSNVLCIALAVGLNIKAYEFILDAGLVISMIWHAVEAYNREIQKLATVISIQITLGWYICSQSIFSVEKFLSIVLFLILSYIPLKPNWHNKHRNRLIYFYALMFVWVVYKFQLANHPDNQIFDFQTKNISDVDKKLEYCALERNNLSVVLENVTATEKFRVASSVENEFREEHLEKSDEGSLIPFDEVLTETTFDTEYSKRMYTANSESKNSFESYEADKRSKIIEDQSGMLQNAQDYEHRKDKNVEVNLNSEKVEPVDTKYSADVNEYVVRDSVVKDVPELQEIKLMENEIETKEETAQTKIDIQEEMKSRSIVDHGADFEKVEESNMQELKLVEKDKINSEVESLQNDLESHDRIKSTNVNHEKVFLKDELDVQELKLPEDEIETKEELLKTDFDVQKELESKHMDHEIEFPNGVSNLQEFKQAENEIKQDESKKSEFKIQERLASKNIVDEKREFVTDHSNLQEDKVTEDEIRQEDKSEKNELKVQEGLKHMNILGEEKKSAKEYSNLQEDSKFTDEKNTERNSAKKKNSLPGSAKKCSAKTKVESNVKKGSPSTNKDWKNAKEIAKQINRVRRRIEAKSNNNKRKSDTKSAAKEGSATEIHKSIHTKRKGYNFVENDRHVINEEINENDVATKAYMIEDLPVADSYETSTSETDENQGRYLIYTHRRGKYYVL